MQYDSLIIGAGAAGMMCAAHAKGSVLLVDHAKAAGEKIRISGGGRCNFTNLHCGPHAYLSQNPHFMKSALARYTQWDFIDLLALYKISWHEKTLGQLFCDTSAKDIIAMLHDLMQKAGVELCLSASISNIRKDENGFTAHFHTAKGTKPIKARHLVIATGGKSIPKMGASGFAYEVAAQFGLSVVPTRPALVPFTFSDNPFAPLSGLSLPTRISTAQAAFEEALLFTHRGLSGPAVLQISSYWQEGMPVCLNLDPQNRIFETLRSKRQQHGRKNLTSEMAQLLPARLVDVLASQMKLRGNLADQSDKRLREIVQAVQNWQITPTGTEGYRTAEVTLGGVDTGELSSKTMEAKSVSGLYFIGEAVDVTGWLGGYNFQWAWSSAMAAARTIAQKNSGLI